MDILAIELGDLDAAARVLPIIQPFAGEVATNMGPVAAYVGRLASLLGHHTVAACRVRRVGELDVAAHDALGAAERICTAQGLPNLLATIAAIRG